MQRIIRLVAVAALAAVLAACGSSSSHPQHAAASASASISVIQHNRAVQADEKLIRSCERKNGAATKADWEKNLACAGLTSASAKRCAARDLEPYFLARFMHHQKGQAASLVVALAGCRTAK